MLRLIASLVTLLLLSSLAVVQADILSWTDSEGTVHFTEDPGLVPAAYRNAVRTLDKSAPPPDEGSVAREEIQPPDAPTAADTADTADAVYGDKSYDQWVSELAERESAMTAVRNRIDEIAVLLKKAEGDWDVQKSLFAEHKVLSAQFKEMKAAYFQHVEIARKAGLQVNIQQ